MIRINLLKPETKEIKEGPPAGLPEYRAKKGPTLGNLIILLLIIALAATYFLQKKAIDKENALLATAKEEKSQLQYVIQKLDEVNRQKSSLERRINLINQLKSQQGVAVHIMDEISKCLPEWVWLTETSFNGKQIQVKGRALPNNLIADFIFNLENSPVLESVNLVSSTQKTSRLDEYLEFGLNAMVTGTQAPEAAAAQPQKTKQGGKR
ncbi:MAG: PilN domain-containing protein [Acidobacteriota bacterium]|nr:PilN domain-containing protein [Acidobacteriota bacterium]